MTRLKRPETTRAPERLYPKKINHAKTLPEKFFKSRLAPKSDRLLAVGVRMRGGYLRFQAQYLRRIRVPNPASLSASLRKRLRAAFELQDFDLANKAALEAYQIDKIPT